MDALARIEATEEIRRLRARYFRLLDTKQWEEFEQLFVEDVIFYGSDGSTATRGRAGFVAAVRAMLHPSRSLHAAYLSEIDFVDRDHATGIWPMHDILSWAEGEPRSGKRRIEGWGHYHDTYRRTPDGWRIASSRLVRLHEESE